MARIRSIKPEFFKHGDLQDLEIANPGQYVMLVYAGLWTQCDKNGVFYYKARELKNEILPYIVFDMQRTLDILEKEGYFIKYTVENREYGYIPKFSKYQFPVKNEKDSPPKYPAPPNNIDLTKNTASTTNDSGNVRRNDSENIPTPEGIRNKEEGIRKKEEGRRKDESFSLSEEFNPSFGDFSQRVEKLRKKYNDLKIGPPFKRTALNLSSAESSDLDKIMRVYNDAYIIKAMENYEKIKKSAEHDLGNCVYRGFVNFIIRGAEKFCDEANPFELFKRKSDRTRSPPITGSKKTLSGLNSTF
jgi:hypothetical protein